MKILRLAMLTALVTVMFSQCETIIPGHETTGGNYTVTVENVSTNYLFFESGVSPSRKDQLRQGLLFPEDRLSSRFMQGPTINCRLQPCMVGPMMVFMHRKERESAFTVMRPPL